MATENVCLFNKFGFCKFLDRCKYRHEQRICENGNCEIEKCSLRHPKNCRYWKEFRMCKFGDYCFFNHKINDDENDEIKTYKDRIDDLEKVLRANTEDIKSVQNREILQLQKIEALSQESI